MILKHFFKISWRNVVGHRSRSLVLGTAIALVTCIMILFLSLTKGIEGKMLESATALFSGDVNIGGFYKINQSSAAPLILNAKPLLKYVADNIPEKKFFVSRIMGFGRVISDTNSIQTPMWGVNIMSEKGIRDTLKAVPGTKGRLEDLEKRGGVVLFAEQAKKLRVGVGDAITVSVPTFRNIYNTKDLKVVAVLKDIGILSSLSLYLHADDLRELYQIPQSATGQIMISLKSQNDLQNVEDRIRQTLTKKGYLLMEKEARPSWTKFRKVAGEAWTGQKIDVTTWEDQMSFLRWIIIVFRFLGFFVSLVLIFMVVIGLMNALWMAIKERTQEIGTMRALGLQKNQVIFLFVLEAFFLAILSSFAGSALGFSGIHLFNIIKIPLKFEALKLFFLSDTLNFAVVPNTIIFPFMLITFFVTLGALYPSWRASRMSPINALSDVH